MSAPAQWYSVVATASDGAQYVVMYEETLEACLAEAEALFWSPDDWSLDKDIVVTPSTDEHATMLLEHYPPETTEVK